MSQTRKAGTDIDPWSEGVRSDAGKLSEKRLRTRPAPRGEKCYLTEVQKGSNPLQVPRCGGTRLAIKGQRSNRHWCFTPPQDTAGLRVGHKSGPCCEDSQHQGQCGPNQGDVANSWVTFGSTCGAGSLPCTATCDSAPWPPLVAQTQC